MTTQAQKFWDKTAEKYAASPVSDEATYQKKLAQTQSYLRPDMRVLEFGCGTGTTALHHAPHVAYYEAIDFSENMLAIGRAKANEGKLNNLNFTHATLTTFGGEPGSWDAVLGLNVLHLIAERQAAIAEAARLLKPGGVFVSSTVCLSASPLRFIKWVAPIGKLLGLMPDVYIFSESELAAEIVNAGFSIVSQWHHGKDGFAVFIVARKV